MKRFFLLAFISLGHALLPAQNILNKNAAENFYEVFLSEERAIIHNNAVAGGSSGGENPPTPPASAIPPAPITGFLPVVIKNTTGLDPSTVFVTIAGQQTVADLTQYFFQVMPDAKLSAVTASATTYSPDYSYPLSSLTPSTTGADEYIVYAPNLNGARFYFSVGKPIYLASDVIPPAPMTPPNKIVAPTYYAFYDPNYNNLFESVEITFFPTGGGSAPAIPWTASVNTTEVDAFCLPIRISYFSFDPTNPNAVTPMVQDSNALPSGFGVGGFAGATTRSGILTSVVNGLNADDMTGASPKVWPRLAIPFYSDPYTASGLQTYLRVLSPKQSLGNAASPATVGNITVEHLPAVDGTGTTQFKNYNYPPFPSDYLTATTYGDVDSFAASLLGYYTDPPNLYLSTGGQTPNVYNGTTTGTSPNLLLTMDDGTPADTSTLSQTDINTFEMFSGSLAFSGGTQGATLGDFFGDAFTVGVIPSTIGTSAGTPINITDATPGGWQATYTSQYYSPANSSIPGGPWYDVYAKHLHNVAVRNSSTTVLNNYGLCYGYDYDDSLGISGTITPVITTSSTLNPYLGITLGSIDTPLPNPYSDNNTYSVTFNFPGGRTLQYQQGSGPIVTVTSGQSFNNIVSNSTNPLRIFYTNGQGPTGTHEFIVYLYYQFLVPIGAYNNSEINIINSTTITPDSPSLNSFTITLLP